MNDELEILRLIRQAKAEGKSIQFGERECSFCHADLGDHYPTLMIRTPELTAYIRLCNPCARRFDVEEGIFQLIRGKAGEQVRGKA